MQTGTGIFGQASMCGRARNATPALAILIFVLSACVSDTEQQEISDSARLSIEMEVVRALEGYKAALMAGDEAAMTDFWGGGFEDFLHAGDGRVFGDRDTWIEFFLATQPDRYLSITYSDVHIAVLSSISASYTANFEFVTETDGEELRSTGAWTYVLGKGQGGWRVVHSNGTHNEFSYYDSPLAPQ